MLYGDCAGTIFFLFISEIKTMKKGEYFKQRKNKTIENKKIICGNFNIDNFHKTGLKETIFENSNNFASGYLVLNYETRI